MGTNANFGWLPSTARVVSVDGFGPFPRGTLQLPPTPMVWPSKDPGDTLDFIVDYSLALAGNAGDAIETLDVTISPNNAGDLTLNTSSADGNQAVLWLAGGQAGTVYAVTVVVGMNSGRNIARTVSLPVILLATAGAFGNVLTVQSGLAVTDEAGQPITVD